MLSVSAPIFKILAFRFLDSSSSSIATARLFSVSVHEGLPISHSQTDLSLRTDVMRDEVENVYYFVLSIEWSLDPDLHKWLISSLSPMNKKTLLWCQFELVQSFFSYWSLIWRIEFNERVSLRRGTRSTSWEELNWFETWVSEIWWFEQRRRGESQKALKQKNLQKKTIYLRGFEQDSLLE